MFQYKSDSSKWWFHHPCMHKSAIISYFQYWNFYTTLWAIYRHWKQYKTNQFWFFLCQYLNNNISATFDSFPLSCHICECSSCSIHRLKLRNIMRLSMKPALLSGFLPTHADFTECISNHETKQTSKFQSDPSCNCFTIDVLNINGWLSTVYFLLSYFLLYRILHKFCSVLRCDILGIGLF